MILRTIDSATPGATVALLHGLFGAARNFGRLQKALSESYRVLAFDLRNHGDSPHDPALDFDLMAQDVLDTLVLHQAVPAAVVGHSMGGKVAMRTALANPAAVSRLLVADISPVPYLGGFAKYAAAMRAMDLAPGLTRPQASAALLKAVPDPAVRGFLLQNLSLTDPPSWRIGLDEISNALPALLDWPPFVGARYDGPTLFVAGAHSDYIRSEHHAAIRSLFPAATFATLAGAGHWLHADNPAGFLAITSEFLAN